MIEQVNGNSLPNEARDTITKTNDPTRFVHLTLNGQLSEYTPDSTSERSVNLITAACANEMSVLLNRKQYRVSQKFLGTRPLDAISKYLGDTEFEIIHFKARSTETPKHLIENTDNTVLLHVSFEYFCMINAQNTGQQAVRFTISILAKSGQNEVAINYVAGPIQALESMRITPSEISIPNTRNQLTSVLAPGSGQKSNNGIHPQVSTFPTQRHASPSPSNGNRVINRNSKNAQREDRRPNKFLRSPRSKLRTIRPADDAPKTNEEISAFLSLVSESWNQATCFQYSYVFDALTLLENISIPLSDLFMKDPDLQTLPSHIDDENMYEFFRIAQPLLVALMTRGMDAVRLDFIRHSIEISDVEMSDIESEPHAQENHDEAEAHGYNGDSEEDSKVLPLGLLKRTDGKDRDAFS
jgi:hypothetical protein